MTWRNPVVSLADNWNDVRRRFGHRAEIRDGESILGTIANGSASGVVPLHLAPDTFTLAGTATLAKAVYLRGWPVGTLIHTTSSAGPILTIDKNYTVLEGLSFIEQSGDYPAAILVTGTDVELRRCTFTLYDNAIRVTGNGFRMSECAVTGSSSASTYGVRIEGDYARIHNCVVTGFDNGIEVDSASDFMIADCRVSGLSIGIEVISGTEGRIVGNRAVESTGTYGISMDTNTVRTTITGNNCSTSEIVYYTSGGQANIDAGNVASLITVS